MRGAGQVIQRTMSYATSAWGRTPSRRAHGIPTALTEKCQGIIESFKESGTYKSERVLTSAQNSSVSVQGAEGKVGAALLLLLLLAPHTHTMDHPHTPAHHHHHHPQVINFCANNYLGLANHPELVAAAKEALDTHGFGLSSVRFICGTQDIHKQLERAIADFHGMEDAILYPSCFDANAGLFEAILGPEDAIISDELNHASIIDGIRLCKAKRLRYKHMDMADLEEQLRAADAAGSRIKMIATDGVFSMDGDIAPLRDICDLAERYNATVFIDECHATGFLGKHGRGTSELAGVEGRIGIINSTLGKALGGATGGYTAGPAALIDVLRNKARPYLFSNTLAPSVVGASLKVFDMLSQPGSDIPEQLRNKTHHFRAGLREAGFELAGHDDCPIVPVMLYDAKKAGQFSAALFERGILAIAFSFPVVPREKARIRCQVSAAHTYEQLDETIAAFKEVAHDLAKPKL